MSALRANVIDNEARTRQAAISYPGVVAREVPKTKARSRTVSSSVTLVMSLAFISCSSFTVSSIAGFVSLESARASGRQAIQRARTAGRAETAMREDVFRLRSDSALESWALDHGFVTVQLASNSENHAPGVQSR